jgi:hypothetical protein
MAASVYKWLILPLASILFLSARPHPFHVSVEEITHNGAEKTLEISCKIFTDDFEKVLSKTYNTKVDLTNPPNKNAMDSLVKRYIFSHLQLKVNNRAVSLVYVGFETDKEASYGYVEVDNVPSLNRIDISNSIMYDQFDDQVNIMHVIVNGNRKSTKLEYPDKAISVEF